jgi:hypothetical protein
MRRCVLSAVLAAFAVGLVGALPSQARAQYPRRVSYYPMAYAGAYYAPVYVSYSYPRYGYAAPDYRYGTAGSDSAGYYSPAPSYSASAAPAVTVYPTASTAPSFGDYRTSDSFQYSR